MVGCVDISINMINQGGGWEQGMQRHQHQQQKTGRAYLVPRREKRKESALVACPKWPISSAKCSDACGCRASFCIPITCRAGKGCVLYR